MSLYWLCLLPLAASIFTSLIHRQRSVAAGLGVAAACSCLWLALEAPVDDGLMFLGQEWVLEQAGRLLLVFLNGSTAVLLVLAAICDQAEWFCAPALASTGVLSASILLRSLWLSFFFLPAALLVMVLMVHGPSRSAVRGASRFMAWIALPIVCVPAMFVLLERSALSPDPAALARWSAWLGAPLVILWLNLFPSDGAVRLWSRESLDLGPVFLWVVKDMVVVYLLLALWRQYPVLRSFEVVKTLGVAALLTATYSGVLALAQSSPAAVLACAAMSGLGAALQGLAAGSTNAVLAGLFLLVSRSVAILLTSSAVAAMPHAVARESGPGTQPFPWRRILLLTAFAVGVGAMSGLPPLGSFVARRQIYEVLQMTHPYLALAWVAASAGIGLGLIGVGWSLWHTRVNPPATHLRDVALLPVIFLLFLCLSIELRPQMVIALLSESCQGLLPPLSLSELSSCLMAIGAL